MRILEKMALPFLRRMEPERAHALSIKALKLGLGPRAPKKKSYPRLETELAGLKFRNPIGLAAGYDKNAEAISPLLRAGFGFIEVGAVTPKPQSGNLKPRVFRLPEDRAVINRLGFNNAGMDAIVPRLSAPRAPGHLGINLGANSKSEMRHLDYIYVLERCGHYVDFATINVSSPNTERLRELQSKEHLRGLIEGAIETRNNFERPIPIFLKIAPDIDDTLMDDLAELARMCRVDGLILTNTTTSREGLSDPNQRQPGGLSGKPLFALSNEVQAAFAVKLRGEVPIIGVGGISSAQDVYTKIKLGASAVQLYTSLIYNGLSMIPRLMHDLDALLARDGFDHISDAIGCDL